MGLDGGLSCCNGIAAGAIAAPVIASGWASAARPFSFPCIQGLYYDCMETTRLDWRPGRIWSLIMSALGGCGRPFVRRSDYGIVAVEAWGDHIADFQQTDGISNSSHSCAVVLGQASRAAQILALDGHASESPAATPRPTKAEFDRISFIYCLSALVRWRSSRYPPMHLSHSATLGTDAHRAAKAAHRWSCGDECNPHRPHGGARRGMSESQEALSFAGARGPASASTGPVPTAPHQPE